MCIPRSEYPRPQFIRGDWLCLNGSWGFEIDQDDDGLKRDLLDKPLRGRIIVPFCPESKLSGVEHTDFIRAAWYRHEVTIPPEWRGRRVLLHFQAVDYDATVWVNGREVARHRGGWTPFTIDLHGVVEPGQQATITLRVRDDMREPMPRGKQCPERENRGCEYTRTTGIWQTVWMEPVPITYLRRPRITPDVGNSRFRLILPIGGGGGRGLTAQATLSDEDGVVCVAKCSLGLDFSPQLDLPIPVERRRLWSLEDPFLYKLKLELLDAKELVVDALDSYAGLRSIAIDGKAVRLNDKVVFQRLVLDQGYYPDGILTAASEEALVRDIKLALAAGFNGARLHQKVFEERFLYHCDRMGYLVWGEFGDWGLMARPVTDAVHNQPAAAAVAQWLEVLERDYSHPAIVGWCPLNETSQRLTDRYTALDDLTWAMFRATKAMDLTRPVIDASGYSHRVAETDIYDSHLYDQDAQRFREKLAGLARGKPFVNVASEGGDINFDAGDQHVSVPYRGQPYFVSEFGGAWWNPEAAEKSDSWGYGDRPRNIEEFYQRFEQLCNVLLLDPNMFGYCYTQLTDVFQEQNGIYTFERQPKFDLERLRAIQHRRAAIEQE